MDNVTHSIVGLLVAEAAIQLRESRRARLAPGAQSLGAAPTPGFAAAARLVSMLANNAPDADSLYASFVSKPLGSLLHHRGHTHTLVAVPLLAGLAVLVTLGVARWRRWPVERNDRAALFALAVLGVVIHIGLDSLNNYGVHPFWPFYDGWIYGDSIFIVEPLLWAALIPPLVFVVPSRTARLFLASIVLLGVGLCWLRDFVPRSMALVVTGTAVAGALAALRATGRARVALSAGMGLAVGLVFALSSRNARAQVLELSARDFPGAVTHDIILTPMPADPLCWQAILVQTVGARYFARTGIVSVAPGFMPSAECPFDIWATPTAPSHAVAVAPRPELTWVREYSAPTQELGALARSSCVFAALLRFTRAPYWTRDDALGRIAGDVRYDRAAGLDFSDVLLDGVPCPGHVPPWTPPRQELLGAE